jgi:hypothetical protein
VPISASSTRAAGCARPLRRGQCPSCRLVAAIRASVSDGVCEELTEFVEEALQPHGRKPSAPPAATTPPSAHTSNAADVASQKILFATGENLGIVMCLMNDS